MAYRTTWILGMGEGRKFYIYARQPFYIIIRQSFSLVTRGGFIRNPFIQKERQSNVVFFLMVYMFLYSLAHNPTKQCIYFLYAPGYPSILFDNIKNFIWKVWKNFDFVFHPSFNLFCIFFSSFVRNITKNSLYNYISVN